MIDLARLIFIAGILHFGILVASAAVPQVLDWRKALANLDPLFQQLVWVHGAFIVIVIVGFGLLAVLLPDQLAQGTPLARAICLFIALFWTARLGVQFFVFDAKPHLKNRLLAIGYHGLTVVFLYHAIIFSVAACHSS